VRFDARKNPAILPSLAQLTEPHTPIRKVATFADPRRVIPGPRACPVDADVWYFVGLACRAQGKNAESAEVYREALRLRPDFQEALSNLGPSLAGRT
jgi:TPR repeat